MGIISAENTKLILAMCRAKYKYNSFVNSIHGLFNFRGDMKLYYIANPLDDGILSGIKQLYTYDARYLYKMSDMLGSDKPDLGDAFLDFVIKNGTPVVDNAYELNKLNLNMREKLIYGCIDFMDVIFNFMNAACKILQVDNIPPLEDITTDLSKAMFGNINVKIDYTPEHSLALKGVAEP